MQKHGLVISVLVCTALLLGFQSCSIIAKPSLSGNWQASFTTTNTNSPGFITLGATTSATFTVQDTNGNLQIYNMRDTSSFPITWYSGSGTYDGANLQATIQGYYYNVNNQRVDVHLVFNGTAGQSSGSGTWTQTFSLPPNPSIVASGTMNMNKN